MNVLNVWYVQSIATFYTCHWNHCLSSERTLSTWVDNRTCLSHLTAVSICCACVSFSCLWIHGVFGIFIVNVSVMTFVHNYIWKPMTNLYPECVSNLRGEREREREIPFIEINNFYLCGMSCVTVIQLYLSFRLHQSCVQHNTFCAVGQTGFCIKNCRWVSIFMYIFLLFFLSLFSQGYLLLWVLDKLTCHVTFPRISFSSSTQFPPM